MMDDLTKNLLSLTQPFEDVYEDPQEEVNRIWLTRDKREIPITEMTDSHLRNALSWWRDWCNPANERFSERHSNSEQYNKFQMIANKLKGKKSKVFHKYVNIIAHTKAMHLNPKYKYLWEEFLKRGLKR
jgi:hypothetical protein